MTIALNVKKRVAYAAPREAVTGNSYTVGVTLDAEWAGASNLRVRAVKVGADGYEDFAISDGSASVEIPEGIPAVELGVWSDTIHTTSPARVRLLPSIMDLTRDLEEAEP